MVCTTVQSILFCLSLAELLIELITCTKIFNALNTFHRRGFFRLE